ncbi:cysteine proteinase [Microthyrium microscopicum]|uniref:Cysteine proteinase n=1 Tax=Microthyrium microscopicum TaxID=703497 RepID=A0A6A6UHP6_9PEZI|nr:cysteine proteinase [Microthyrium microscopicum]
MLEDLRTVEDNSWLTDNVISFWQFDLERRLLKPAPRTNIKLVRPTEAVLLAHGLNQNVDPSFMSYTHLFLPINPSGGEYAEEGTHWSLLVVSLVDGVAFHYNSMQDHPHIADQLTRNLSRLIRKPLRFIDIQHVPQQHNSRDCGVYVCAFMEELLEHRLLAIDATHKVSMSLKGMKMSAKQYRRQIRKAIEAERTEALERGDRNVLKERPRSGWL